LAAQAGLHEFAKNELEVLADLFEHDPEGFADAYSDRYTPQFEMVRPAARSEFVEGLRERAGAGGSIN
jgi:hypothetical protein